MDNRNIYTEKEIVNLTSQIVMAPSREMIRKWKEVFGEEELIGLAREIREDNSRRRIQWGIAGGVVIAAATFIVMLLLRRNPIEADRYSFEAFSLDCVVDMDESFLNNRSKSDEMYSKFLQSLPYEGKYKKAITWSEEILGGQELTECMVNGLASIDYPGYYAGRYINTEGKLIVQIPQEFNLKDYRNSDWYSELVEMLGSEDFRCHSVRYSYTELMNGITAVLYGGLSEQLKNAGIPVETVEVNEYFNRIEVTVQSQADKMAAEKILTSGIFTVFVINEKGEDD